MKKLLLTIAVPLISFLSVLAQITQEEAEIIVQKHVSSKINPFSVYAKENMQTEGISIITSLGENVEIDYPCWVYYVKSYTLKTDNSYIIVKENLGNLLEINVKNVNDPDDLKAWKLMTIPCTVGSVSPCASFLVPKGDFDDIIELLYVDGKLRIKRNSWLNCAFEIINVAISFDGETIKIYENEEPSNANCICDVDFEYTAGKFEQGTYHLIIYLNLEEVFNQVIKIE